MSPVLDPERWARVEAIFNEAVEMPEHERPRYLDLACGGDPALRAEVDTLLAHTERDLSVPVEGVARLAHEALEHRTTLGVGSRLGPYRLDSVLGAGGIGIVYLGVPEHPGLDRVAVKMMLGAAYDRHAMRHFRTESKLLDGLSHPNVARLLGSGETPEGVPYVMTELVEGRPLDVYCEETALDVPARIRLFLPVCSAVRYAHQRSIVHRDLKPGNVLVTAEGVPKLLDFGIAKVLIPGETLSGLTTTRLMTPMYASPEQLRGERIGEPSDIYSLGLILYRLLAGRLPFDAEPGEARGIARRLGAQGDFGRDANAAGDPGTAEEVEPPAPSAVSGRPDLGGPLDAIVLKALRHRPEERYPSVVALIGELQRYLENPHPPAAASNPWAFGLGKLVGRWRK